ncbi:carbohydrate kinase family protein [Paenibacillus koleovorans]|uniref:carbohydrate kinase family protein n=1 Tax=Paenibacillus koleovorans TaxID=121608 RepID=UPI001FEA0764|nr:carbohydrate kinase family protein [Paenibacillus koleovorans]
MISTETESETGRRRPAEVVVAGHICLDIIPQMQRETAGGASGDPFFVPGKLVDIGPAVTSTGGAVPNTGLALHRLGVPVRLMGKLGGDLFGRSIQDLLEREGEGLSAGLIVSPEAMTSYTIVVSPPGEDRMFLHCPGANDTFSAADVREADVASARLFHFGYPPLMKGMFEHGGRELVDIFARVKAQGVTTSLDMARPDPNSPSGRVEWLSLLERLLPQVDVFLPSFEELLFMLERDRYLELDRELGAGRVLEALDDAMLRRLADRLLGLGAAIVGIKLGEYGLYVKTTADASRLRAIGACWRGEAAPGWLDRELLAPCYAVVVTGTTGAGDCTIAGFLAGLLQGLPLERIALGAVAVGACNVERPDATSGIPSWDAVERRMAAGWEQRQMDVPRDETRWHRHETNGLWESNNRNHA